jgi:hypothetical protein
MRKRNYEKGNTLCKYKCTDFKSWIDWNCDALEFRNGNHLLVNLVFMSFWYISKVHLWCIWSWFVQWLLEAHKYLHTLSKIVIEFTFFHRII